MYCEVREATDSVKDRRGEESTRGDHTARGDRVRVRGGFDQREDKAWLERGNRRGNG